MQQGDLPQALDQDLRSRPSLLAECGRKEGHVYACFSAVFQGDHLGVEVATCSRANFCRDSGLLGMSSEVKATSLFPDGRLLEGLVIDDHFAISIEQADAAPAASESVKCLEKATSSYQASDLRGSHEKEVIGADIGKVAGAELHSSAYTRRLGLALAAAPRAKRLSLASISLALASPPRTSEGLHACLMGGWTSCLLYRRPLGV